MGLSKKNHPSHSEHFLLLKDPDEPYQCNGCKELGFGPCYECEHQGCSFYLHEACANATPSASHPFLKCSLKFHSTAPQMGGRFCDACGEDVLGFVYQCKDKNPHDYHPGCLKLQRTLAAKDGTVLYLRDKLPLKCLHCGSRETSNRIKGWSYVSSCRQYCYHVACVKEMILEKWRTGYFLQDHGNLNEENRHALQTNVIPSKEIIIPSGKSSSKAKKIWSTAKTVIMLIISALFGEPTTLISLLVQQLISN